MKKPIKAALISALVFPGAGHFYLRRYGIGLLLVLCTAAALYLLMSTAISEAFSVADKLVASGAPLDEAHITDLVNQQSQRSDQSMSIATIVLFVVWVISIVDSYRVALAQERGNVNAADKTA